MPAHEHHLQTLESERLCTLQEAFSAIRVGTTKGYQLINEGKLEAVKNGTRTFIKQSEVARFINQLPSYK